MTLLIHISVRKVQEVAFVNQLFFIKNTSFFIAVVGKRNLNFIHSSCY